MDGWRRFALVLLSGLTACKRPAQPPAQQGEAPKPAAAAPAPPAGPAAARSENKRGMKLYRTKDYAGAAAAFRSAIAADASLVLAHYNLACVLALSGDKAGAIANLEWLKESPDLQAARCLVKAAVDRDLAALRAEPKVQAILAAGAARAAAGDKKEDPLLPPLPLFVKEVRASSTQVDKADASRYAARNALFYRLKGAERDEPQYQSAWCEGKPDEGLGESLTIALALPSKLDKLRIAAGVWKSASLFKSSNRITRLDVSIDGKPPIPLTVPPGRTHAELPLGGTSLINSLEIRIAAVEKGRENSSCLSAVQLFRDEQEQSLVEVSRDPTLNELPGALTAIQKALKTERTSAALLEPLLEFPFSNHDKDCATGGTCPDKTIVHKNLASLIKACRKWERAADETQLEMERACPTWGDSGEGDTRPLGITWESAGRVRVTFPSHNEMLTEWLLVHRDTSWRLAAIDAVGFDIDEGEGRDASDE